MDYLTGLNMTKMLLVIVELFYVQLKQYLLKIDISGGLSGQNIDL